MDPFAGWPQEKVLRVQTIARFAAAIGRRLLDKKHAVANCVIRELDRWSSNPKNLLSPEGVVGLYVISHPPSQAIAHLYDAARFFRKPEKAKLSLEQALRLTDKLDHPARTAVIKAWASDIPEAPVMPKPAATPPRIRIPAKPSLKKRHAQKKPLKDVTLCSVCSVSIRHETDIWKSVGWYETKPTVAPHIAPCGRPCLGGRIRHEQFGMIHHDADCGACARRIVPLDADRHMSERDEWVFTMEFEIR